MLEKASNVIKFDTLEDKLEYFSNSFDAFAANAFLIDINKPKINYVSAIKLISEVCLDFYRQYVSDEELTFNAFVDFASDSFKFYLYKNFDDLSEEKKDELCEIFTSSLSIIGAESSLVDNNLNYVDLPYVESVRDKIASVVDIFEHAIDQEILSYKLKEQKPNRIGDYVALAQICADEYANMTEKCSINDYVQKCLEIYLQYWFDAFGTAKDEELSLGMSVFENKLRSNLEKKRGVKTKYEEIENDVLNIGTIESNIMFIKNWKDRFQTLDEKELMKLQNFLLSVIERKTFRDGAESLKVNQISILRVALEQVRSILLIKTKSLG